MRVFVFASILVLALTGCKPLWEPTFMPSGYAHHSNDYKSPPGTKAKNIGYDYTHEKNDAVLEQWRVAASDLILRAEANGIQPDAPIFLSTDIEHGAFQSAYDFVLRDELRAHGYVLTLDPQEAYHLFYSAYDPSESGQPESVDPVNLDDAVHANKDGDFLPPSDSLELVLAATQNGVISQKVSALYDVPLYGFKPAGYLPLHERPRRVNIGRYDKDTGNGYNP